MSNISRMIHFIQRLYRETKAFPGKWRNFGFSIAVFIWWDGIWPTPKKERYIRRMKQFTDVAMKSLEIRYEEKTPDFNGCLPAQQPPEKKLERIPVWCCWWQGEEQMPDVVKLCQRQLTNMIPKEKAELHMLSFQNYQEYVTLPEEILRKFQEKKITMTALSDVLRFFLLADYGGVWVDATVYFSEPIPDVFFQGHFYSQRMRSPSEWKHEACQGKWCGFLMAGPANHVVFRYMKDAFTLWWSRYEDMIDYVLIDYLLMTGYRSVWSVRREIDRVPPNHEEIFRMYAMLNEPYSEQLYRKLTEDNGIHKLTYKMRFAREAEQGGETLYQYMQRQVEHA